MENLPVNNPNTSGNKGGPVITHGSGGSQSDNPINRNMDSHSRNSSDISKNWSDIEQTMADKAHEIESRTRGYILQSPFKALMAVGSFGLLLGYVVSKIRA